MAADRYRFDGLSALRRSERTQAERVVAERARAVERAEHAVRRAQEALGIQGGEAREAAARSTASGEARGLDVAREAAFAASARRRLKALQEAVQVAEDALALRRRELSRAQGTPGPRRGGGASPRGAGRAGGARRGPRGPWAGPLIGNLRGTGALPRLKPCPVPRC